MDGSFGMLFCSIEDPAGARSFLSFLVSFAHSHSLPHVLRILNS
jgi:hypothetical protein